MWAAPHFLPWTLYLWWQTVSVSAQLLIQGHKSKEPSKCSVILGKELSNTLPLSITSPKHNPSPRYPERVDCSEWPSHTRSCRLLLHFFWFLTMKDADGGLSMNSPHQQDLMSLQLVFIGLSLYGITLLHVLTWPPTHTPHILTSAIRVRSPDTGNCTPYLSGLICFSQSFWSLSAHSTNCWRDYWAGLPAGC